MQTTLRRATRKDLDFIVRAERADENRAWIVAWTRVQHRRALIDPDYAVMVVESAGAPVGYVILAGCARRRGSVEFKRLVITEKGRGFGREAVRHVKLLAFGEWGTGTLWLDVKPDNERAHDLYVSEGFVRALGTGDQTDEGDELIVMSMSRAEYQCE